MPHSLRLLALFFLCATHLFAQSDDDTGTGLYFVGFADKTGSPFSTDRPGEFLSPRALIRRAKNDVRTTEMDLPISPAYEQRVQQTGAQLWLRSKWMNGVVVVAAGPQVTQLRELPFVDTVYFAAPVQYERRTALPQAPNYDRTVPSPRPVPVNQTFYGSAWDNLARMRGDSLHRIGYRGQGVYVAVLDGGFPNVEYPDFLGYNDDGAVPAGYDLVEQDSTVLDGSTHGATVLSTMAAHHPFFYVGTAPEAKYVLFKTENGQGEHRMEEINYAIALEISDSLGVDVVNSSLGYTTFGLREMSYTYDDLDGRTSPASIAADRAFDRGIIVVTSAGNNGADNWKYIGTPGDARNILTVGALDANNDRAYFSSFGPTADGRIKPDVSAPGVSIPAVAANGVGLTAANGTSLACPLVTGLIACLVQAVPDATAREIVDAVRHSASQADTPDNVTGHGLPDFGTAYRLLMDRRRP